MLDIDDNEEHFRRNEYETIENGQKKNENVAQLTIKDAALFDLVTTPNEYLVGKFGGIKVPHARPVPTPNEVTREVARTRLGINNSDKVILFLGSEKTHKGVIELAQSINRLNQPELLLLVVGTLERRETKDVLTSLLKDRVKVLPACDLSEQALYYRAADYCALLQNTYSEVAQWQTPAKLTDCARYRVPVLATRTRGMEEFHKEKLLATATDSTDLGAFRNFLKDDHRDMVNRFYAYFAEHMSSEAQRKRLIACLNLAGLKVDSRSGQLTNQFIIHAPSNQGTSNETRIPIEQKEKAPPSPLPDISKFLRHLNDRNEETAKGYWGERKKAESRHLKVMIGTLYCGENEFQACAASIGRQSHKIEQHLVIKDKPNIEAHNTLYESFLSSDSDILIKVDADMILIDPEFVSKVVELVKWSRSVAIFQLSILDGFTGLPIQGINVYTKLFKWDSKNTDSIFTDRAKIPFSRKRVIWGSFTKSVIHAPNPSPFQAFHFGVHRALKHKIAKSNNDNSSAQEQLTYLRRTLHHFKIRRSPALYHAALGIAYGLANEIDPSEIDYGNPFLRNEFEAIVSKHPFSEPSSSARILKIAADLLDYSEEDHKRTSSVQRICFLLPHLEIFGGILRFLEISHHMINYGISAHIAIPGSDNNTNSAHRINPKFSNVPVISIEDALHQAWDVVICGDFSSGLILSLPWFNTRISGAYLLNGWQHRHSNVAQILLARPEVCIANSSYAAQHHPELAPYAIPGGISVDLFNNGESPPQEIKGPTKVYVPVGRNKPRKRFIDAYKALQLVAKTHAIEMHTIDALDLENLSIGNLKHIHHRGLSRIEVAEMLRSMHIAIFPEEDAGWNNPAAEAMAMGCPTVCTNAGTTDFAVDGETALIFKPRDVDQIKEHCLKLITNKDLREKISRLGIKRVRQFDWKNTTRQLIDYLELCLTADQYHQSAQPLTQKQIIEACNGIH